jgi:hypothetical protein
MRAHLARCYLVRCYQLSWSRWVSSMRGAAAAVRALPSALPRVGVRRLAPPRCVALAPRQVRRAPLAVSASLRPAAGWLGPQRHLHSGRVLQAPEDGEGGVVGSSSAVSEGDALSQDAAILDALVAMLEEEELSDRERAVLEHAIEEARAGRTQQALQALDMADEPVSAGSTTSGAAKLPEDMDPEETACATAPHRQSAPPSPLLCVQGSDRLSLLCSQGLFARAGATDSEGGGPAPASNRGRGPNTVRQSGQTARRAGGLRSCPRT